ncbi:MAG: UDP binding domain-containing protein [Candidatus Bathyarchaeia archaeon]
MPAMLRLMPEAVDTIEKRGNYTVTIVGCQEIGAIYALAFAEAGYKVLCVDLDLSSVKRLSRGKVSLSYPELENKLRVFTRARQLNTENSIKTAVSKSDIIILATASRINDKKNLAFSELENVCKQVGAALRQGALVIYGQSFGFTNSAVKEILENTSGLKVGEDFGLAYAPFHAGYIAKSRENDVIVAADDKSSLNSASLIIATVMGKNVRQVSDIKLAELATLFAFARQDLNTALSNELAILCEKIGVNYFEINRLIEPEACGGLTPSITVEHGRAEMYFLLETAENLNSKLRLVALARKINEDMIRHGVILLQDALRCCGKTLRRAKVAVLGAIAAHQMATSLVKLLEAKGAKISIYDPFHANNESLDGVYAFKKSVNEALESADCVVILTLHEQFRHLNMKKLRTLMKMPAAIVDLTGHFASFGIEAEGFIYYCFGRGVESK